MNIELKAEVFRIIRNNADKTKTAILKEIKEQLPGVSQEDVIKALLELIDNT